MRSIWESAPFGLFLPCRTCSFWEWLCLLRKNLTESEFVLSCVVSWRIWFQRNRAEHDEDTQTEVGIVEWSNNFLHAYLAAQLLAPNNRLPKFNAELTPPPASIIRINVDVGFLSPDFFQVGLVASDSNATCVKGRAKRLVGSPSPLAGEARATLEGLRFARERGCTAIRLLGDCLQIIRAIQEGSPNNYLPYGAIISECVDLCKSFSSFSCSFIKRLGNNYAPRLLIYIFQTL